MYRAEALRTALLYILPAILVASGWGRLSEGADGGVVAGMLLLGLLPALVPRWWGKALAAVAVTAYAAWEIWGVTPGRGFFSSVWAPFQRGFLEFYDVPQPFPAAEYPLMQGVLLAATFGFALAIALAIAARRPLIASLILLVGSIWPATLVPGTDLVRGAVTLAVVLLLLAFGSERRPRALQPAFGAAALLVAVAVAASTAEAVAKPAFLSWQQWDIYDRPADPVSLDFVWDATYQPFEWPEEETTVLKVTGPQRQQYWRATTLDTFMRDRWLEDLVTLNVVEGPTAAADFDGLTPERARDRESWLQAEVRVEALRGRHLVGPSVPVAYDPKGAAPVRLASGGVALAAEELRRGAEYTVWAYVPAPKPEELARSTHRQDFRLVRRYLEVGPGMATPAFRDPDREEIVDNMLTRGGLAPYRVLYERARSVVGEARNQYTAVVALEAWFRAEGGFTYTEAPPAGAPGEPPLVAFLRHQQGYCQHYAGAMTLMLRYLGIPARVAVGFTSGSYDQSDRTWTVTDHEAHAWVEVWFPDWGWLPFDPTPGRGELSNPSSYSAPNFDAAAAARIFDANASGGAAAAFADHLRGLSERRAGEEFVPDVVGGGSYVPFVRERGASLLRLLLLVGLAGAAAIVLVKRVVRGRRFLTRDARRLAAACRSELADFLADQAMALPRSATPAELAAEVNRQLGVDGRAFAAALAAARYAPPRESRAASRRLRRELRLLRRAVRRRLGVPRRLAGAVSLRSLAA